MRIDKFLKVSRILKRRTVAQDACDSGKVIINGKEVKPSHPVKVGDVVSLNYATGTLTFKINDIREVVKKDEASSLYEIVENIQ
jgi:ribosomal 50S subunit-recycling heat shock protein